MIRVPGLVKITSEGIEVHRFTFEQVDFDEGFIEAMRWAIARLEEEIQKNVKIESFEIAFPKTATKP